MDSEVVTGTTLQKALASQLLSFQGHSRKYRKVHAYRYAQQISYQGPQCKMLYIGKIGKSVSKHFFLYLMYLIKYKQKLKYFVHMK
jgi:hypothetical protein